jgi:hypothetical protein
MANPVRGQVPLLLGGLAFTLEFTIDAICALEAETGETAQELFRSIQSNTSLGFLRKLMWAALLEHHPGYTLKAAGELLRLPGGQHAAAALVQAFVSAWPDPEEAAEGEARPRKRRKAAAPDGTGPSSTSSGAATA